MNRHNYAQYRFGKTPPPPPNATKEDTLRHLTKEPMRAAVENDNQKLLAEIRRRVANARL